jgi:hypothetical protein
MFGLFKTRSLDEEIGLRIQIAQRAVMTYVADGDDYAFEAFKICFEATRRRNETEGLICMILDKLAADIELSQNQTQRYNEILEHMAFGFETFDIKSSFNMLQKNAPSIFKAIRKCDVALAERSFLS